MTYRQNSTTERARISTQISITIKPEPLRVLATYFKLRGPRWKAEVGAGGDGEKEPKRINVLDLAQK